MAPPGLTLSPQTGNGEGDLAGALPGAPSARAEAAARHESAHLIAAHVLGRPLGGAHANGDGGGASVGLLRPNVGAVALEEVVGDLTILTIGTELDRRCYPRFGESAGDAERAWAVASAYTPNPDEAAALIDFARAKARTLLDHGWVGAQIEQLSAALLDAGALDGAQVAAILDPEGGNDGKA
jgi:hypothetical protein